MAYPVTVALHEEVTVVHIGRLVTAHVDLGGDPNYHGFRAAVFPRTPLDSGLLYWYEDYGITWLKGKHAPDSLAGKALLVANALCT